MISLELPADLRALRVVAPWLQAVLDYSAEARVEEVAPKMELALQEICVNVVEHAYADTGAGRIRLEYTTIDDHHHFVIVDQGVEFDPSSKPVVDLSRPTVGGYGLFVAEKLCDGLSYQRRGMDNCWTLTLRRSTQVQH